MVHGTNYVVPPTGWPTVVSVHDLTLFQRPELVLPVVRTFGSVIRRAVDKGAYVHTISQVVADEVKALLHTDRVRVVYPGPTYDPNQAPGELPDGLVGRRFILSIGTREPRKNLPRLVAAFGQVHDQNHGIVLVLAGSPGTDDAAIADALGKLPHEAAENVRLLGYVDDATRAALFTHATVFAYPSLDEGFGLPLLEAMHYRVPIVTSTAGALPEIAADAALLVDPTDTTATAHALHIALTDEPTRRRLVEAGTRRGRAFSWTTAADEMVDLYHHVLEHS